MDWSREGMSYFICFCCISLHLTCLFPARREASCFHYLGEHFLSHSLEDNLKRTNCHHRTTGARWQRGSWAYFRHLSIPQWQEKESLMCCLLLFSLDLGWCQYLCKTKWGGEGRHGGEINVTQVPKKYVFFLCNALQGHCFCCICVKWHQSVFFVMFFWMLEVNMCCSLEVTDFSEGVFYTSWLFLLQRAASCSASF